VRVRTETLEFAGSGGDTLPAFAAFPDGRGSAPGVLVIHTIFGLDAHIKDVTQRVAQAGYVALAPDLMAREGTTDPRDLQGTLRRAWAMSDLRLFNDLDAALALLNGQGRVEGRMLALLGLDWGGSKTLLFATHTDELAGAIVYYGRLRYEQTSAEQPKAPLEAAAEVRCPVQVHYGDRDYIPVGQVRELQNILRRVAQDGGVYIYPGASHNFNDDRKQDYHPESAALAWERTLQFLKERLAA
jgi:carboxymethylenebutenolidase